MCVGGGGSQNNCYEHNMNNTTRTSGNEYHTNQHIPSIINTANDNSTYWQHDEFLELDQNTHSVLMQRCLDAIWRWLPLAALTCYLCWQGGQHCPARSVQAV